MNLDNQSLVNLLTKGNLDNRLNAQAIHATRSIPVTSLGNFIGSSERVKPYRAPDRLSPFVSAAPLATVAGEISVTVDRSTKNIADWASYLPADCIETMVSLGWDRTT